MAAFPSAKILAQLNAGDGAVTSKAKGDALEEAICLCLESLAGIEVIERNCISAPGSSEIDIVLHNKKSGANSAVAFLDTIILVECKNWASPVDSKAIRDFLAKVKAAKVKEGILIAANGITGDAKDVTRGHDVIRQAFDTDGTKIIVLTRAEIESFSSAADVMNAIRKRFTNHLLRRPLF